MSSPDASARADPVLMRRLNEVTTLRALFDGGPLTVSGVLDATGLSRTTAEAVLDQLVEGGWVEETPAEPRSGRLGRPARTYRFRAETGRVLGVEVTAHQVRATVADLGGDLVCSHQEPTNRRVGRADRLEAARQVVRRCLAETGELQAAAVGTNGLVDRAGAVRLCRVLPEWTGVHLGEELAPLLSCPLVVENDINLAALAERWRGAAAGVDDLVWMSVGRSTAAAVLIDGTLLRGRNGAAGELGWVQELGWREIRDHPLSFAGVSHGRHGNRAQRTLAAASSGDAAATADVAAFVELLGAGLSTALLAYDPEVLVVGGAVAAAPEVFVPPLRHHLESRSLVPPDVRASTLGDEAVITGAVRLALDEAERRIFATHDRATP